ncbi:MAG TPA: Crp/Fnr family transcriptional regulator [Polyangiaceae bacterium]|nr:Crp/Fnr family transcriptional regulator [Polyangiaceae bacterium]
MPMREHDPLTLIAKIPLFASLEPEVRKPLAALIRVRSYAARQFVVWEGQPGGTLFLSLSGFFKAVTTGADGREMILSVMGPGEVLGELSVLDGQPRSASVVTIEPGELASIDRPALLGLMNSSPELAVGLIEVLARRVRVLTKRFEILSSQDVPERLAQVLLNLAEKHGEASGERVRIPVRLSQQDLANMVGATRESVNKQLRKWTKDGVLRRETGCVIISDVPALRIASGAA